MDVDSMAILNSLKRGGGAGYTSPGAMLTFDGDTTNKVVIFEELEVVKIFDDFLDLNNIKRIECIIQGERNVFEKAGLAILEEDGIFGAGVVGIHLPLVFAVQENTQGAEPGVYANIAGFPDVYVTRIEFAETVHTIKPKFLPGVCLPVVELDTVPSSDGVELSEGDIAKLTELGSNFPFVLKFKLGITWTFLCNGAATISDGEQLFVAGGSFIFPFEGVTTSIYASISNFTGTWMLTSNVDMF